MGENRSHYLSQKYILKILYNLITWGLVSFGFNCSLYSADLKMEDSLSTHHTIILQYNQNNNDNQKQTLNFYKSDSIFSFRSQKGYFPSLLKDFEMQITSPFKLKAKQWLITGAAVGITVALFNLDGEIDEWARVQKQKHSWINKSSPVITRFGGNWGVYSVVATGVLSAICKDEKGVQTSLLATQAMITSGVWVNILKILTGRERPIADYIFSKSEGGEWYGPFAVWDQDLATRKPVSAFDAFPSGHTATAFSIATVIATQYKDVKAIPVICYSAATLVGISRLTEHEHWASDVFVGGILGYLCGKQVVNQYNKSHSGQDKLLPQKSMTKSELTFVQNGNQFGICLRW
ncbi:MAG: phosphatase PAP2 family protein [Bacteroidales bacterium]